MTDLTTRVPMTEFDLRALGWVVTRDALWEITRSLAGRTSRLPTTATQELAERWRALQAVAAKPSAPNLTRTGLGSSLRGVSAETHAATAEYLDVLCASCPELYSTHVVSERCRHASALAIAGFGGTLALGSLTHLVQPLISDVVLVLLLMGAWHLLTFLQLRSVRRLLAQHVRQLDLTGAPSMLP